VVTGGGSGIGQAIALKFAAQGAVIRILDLNESAAAGTCEKIAAAGGSASFHLCDVANQSEVKGRFEEFFRRDRIEILINNAGISHIGTVESTTEEDFDRMVRVNVKGFYNCMYAVVKHMKAFGGGVIVNLASARVHTPFVDGYLQKNYPGREKEMFDKLAKSQPIGRMAEPDEVASLALFLCSDEAAFITGVDYPIDGGFFNLRG
jgi:2-keto-3-deoxy-L-fuconate dehydrogenase